ncbi:hypothetical protein BD324DRAFT_629575 [Kockovaella imperatae]|uniref:N-acetyl-D-glucosamine kinase n=1 Tax=Kockovaella imperatae TaxID=4999 RepID=A0A1Y1UD05_9TREE|nr:hypothetical protein BD324DRAFT_629575 [Kockovaella imperatae]ORX35931.1 hypothetical protein BD324DRAFT_629575 [Kockovaella imperatae]
MTLYLCLDGGGTKTTAVIAFVSNSSTPSSFVRGEAGPSNLTQNGPEICMAALTLATASALSRLASPPAFPPTASSASSSDVQKRPVFRRIWAGIAGCARPPDYALLRPLLQNLFPGSDVRLTGDGELLTAPIYSTPHLDLVTLISGTGSLALRWHRSSTSERVAQVSREGGWGFLLGDEGSGWSLGREGIKSVLTAMANHRDLLPWHRDILRRFNVEGEPHRLLASLTTLDPTLPVAEADSERKKRIAACTKHVVLAAQEGDEEASKAVKRVALEVVELLRPLVETTKSKDELEETILVVGGGLGGVDLFWDQVALGMKNRGWRWASIERISDAALEGVKVIMDDRTWIGD